MDSLPDENTLLRLATEIAYPSDSVLFNIMSTDSRLSSEFMIKLINESPYELNPTTVNKIILDFNIPSDLIHSNFSGKENLIPCYPQSTCNLVLEQITEYDYYDANYKGQSYTPGYNSFKEPYYPTDAFVQLTHEPSWMLHCKKSYSLQQPDAWSEQRYYYYWDRHDGVFPASDVFEKMNIMGWRSLVFQTMERTKAVGMPMKERSTFFSYDRRWHVEDLPDRTEIEVEQGPPCPDGAPPVVQNPDPRPDKWEEFETAVGMLDGERQKLWAERLGGRLLLRDIFVQAAEPILNTSHNYLKTQDEVDWSPPHPECALRLVDAKMVYMGPNEHDLLTFIFPCPVVRTAHFVERNLYHQPLLVQDEKDLRYRYFYKDPEYIAYLDVNRPCNNTYEDNIDFPGMPIAISIGSGLADSLYTSYTYDPLTLLLISETDPNGMITTYEYDKWRRPKAANVNGLKVGTNNYHYWNQDVYDENMSFADRAKENWMEAVVYNSNNANDHVEQTRSYADPLGRAFHTWSRTVTEANLNASASSLLHSGQQEYDSWGRVIKAYKPFVKTGTNMPLAPLSNTVAGGTADDNWSESVYENDPRSRLHFSSKPAVTGTETHRVAVGYNLLKGSVLACELDLSLGYANEMMAQSFNDYVFRRVKTTDEDGKTVWEYTYPNGQKVAERRRIAGQSYAITLFFYDSRGNLRKTVNPEKQQSMYKYNLMGGLYEKTTPDEGITRYMYNRSGQVVLEQDEAMRKGVIISEDYDWNADSKPDLFPYYRQYCYDIYGRMVLQQKLMIQPDHRIEMEMWQLLLTSWPVNALAYTDITAPNTAIPNTNLTNSFSSHFIDRSSLSWLAKAVYNRTFNSLEGGTWIPQTGIHPYYIYEGLTTDPPLLSHATVIPEKKWIYGYNVAEQNSENLGWQYAHESSYARGRLSFTLTYKDMEDQFPLIMKYAPSFTPIVEATWLGYNDKGYLHRERHRINSNGISDDYWGYEYTIDYPAYDLRGNALEQIVDIHADGKADMRYSYTYDARGRLKDVYMALGTGTNNKNKIANYTYDDARGAVSKIIHNVRCGSSDQSLDVISYTYDHRDRLTVISSKWYRENLYYDAQQNLQGLTITQNYNGNINAVQHRHLNGATAINTFNYSNLSDFTDDKKITTYGYTYDGLNRLTKADAKVGQYAHTYGDTDYSFDRTGNILRHSRGWLYGTTNNQPEIWDYKYHTGTNRLLKAWGLNVYTATRNYTYDGNGNLAKDSYRDITAVRYDRSNLPTRISRDYHDNIHRYTYNVADQRIAKLSGSLATEEVENYELYLRDAAGRELATIDVANQTIEWYGYGRERIARFRPQSDQRSLPVLANFAASPVGMLMGGKESLVKYPITLVYGTAHDMPYIYRKDYLARLDTVPEIPDTLARSFVADYEVEIADYKEMLDAIGQSRLREHVCLRIIEQGGVGPIYPIKPWNPWIPEEPEWPEWPETPPPPPSYPLICHCPDREHVSDHVQPVISTFTSFSNTTMENITFYLYDHLGNTRVTYYQRSCGATLTVENILDYDPYGKVLREFSYNNDRERYVTTQHERDKETGYDYRGARFYDSDIARFLSVDPLSNDFPAWSSYNYVMGNPISLIDPSGREPEDWIRNITTGQLDYRMNVTGWGNTPLGYTYEGTTREVFRADVGRKMSESKAFEDNGMVGYASSAFGAVGEYGAFTRNARYGNIPWGWTYR
jgi:RHS repeat-associated protein